jgi:hypothetical protein
MLLAFNCTTSLIHSTPKQNSIINKHINKHLQDFFIFSMIKTLRTPSSCDMIMLIKLAAAAAARM